MRAHPEEPFDRPLRVFAFDPSRGWSPTNVVTLRLPFEQLDKGPIGRYVAVIDREPSHQDIDLNELNATLRDGLDPSELDLRFHHQMAYAVASHTIQLFEQALGRPVRWPWASSPDSDRLEDKLRIYPHDQQVANAWALPDTGELFFGYSVIPQNDGGPSRGGVVYSCLSYHIIAHETGHLLLQATFPHINEWMESKHDDASGQSIFQESFCDLLSVLQQFDFEDVVLDVIQRTGGRIWDLTTAPDVEPNTSQATIELERAGTNPLLEIGRQFGQAVGLGGAIRTVVETPAGPAPEAAAPSVSDPRERSRGALVEAVFDALCTVYWRRAQDLLRIGGVKKLGVAPRPELAKRLAQEASRTARQILRLLIRALDYCPPVGPEPGDLLRAIVTCDADQMPSSDWGFRQALIDSCHARGIHAEGVLAYSEEGLRWPLHPESFPACGGLQASDVRATENARALERYVNKYREALGLLPRARAKVESVFVRTVSRARFPGELQRQFVARVTQFGKRKGGATLILDQGGTPRYVIAKQVGGSAATPESGALSLADLHRSQLRLPERRPLKIFAFDPTRGRAFGNYLTVSVPYEQLEAGPIGRQVAVIDYDASNKRYYEAVDLETEGIQIGGGIDPSDLDPLFHQQMVYALSAAAIERFEIGLARPIVWRWVGNSRTPLSDKLLIYPHAMHEANAYYDRALHGLLFGYFSASEESPGSNLPGQIVYTCLSHDIVVHETTHALLDSIRPYFLERTGVDAPAFHEAFADIIALLQHFSFRDALRETIERTGGRIHSLALAPMTTPGPGGPLIEAELSASNPLVGLAQQFGEALGTRAALRSALGTPRDPTTLPRLTEPHARGAVLVAAMFDAFFGVYVSRTADLMDLARAGGAITQWGNLHPDLAERLAREATSTAQRFANMCVRALDYCPPVAVEFGDFLRALITADAEVEPTDPLGYRAALIDAFRARGIYPSGVRSFSEEALKWEPSGLGSATRCKGLDPDMSRSEVVRKNAILLRAFAREHARDLGLSASAPINAADIASRASERIDPHGAVRPEFHVQFVQRREEPIDPAQPDGPKFVFRGGATAVLDESGAIRYLIGKSFDNEERLQQQREYVQGIASAGPSAAYMGAVFEPLNLAALHRGFEG